MKFSELSLTSDLQRSLADMGYDEMTPIQESAIPHILEGKDLIGLAETGSGKTSACAVPLVQMVDPKLSELQALILVPTRELAQQYVSEIAKVSQHTDVAPFAMFGGFDMDIQRAKLKDGVHILVATPGRLIDYVWNNPLPLNHIKTVVLDEADEMMKMGFIENVDFIFSCMMQDHQTLLFSATMPKEVKRLAEAYQTDPVQIELNRDQVAPQSLRHCFKVIREDDRLKALTTYLRQEKIRQAILFCNSRSGSSRLLRDLRGAFDSVEIIHGGLEQPQRTSIFNRFRSLDIKLLVATDVAARGLDFDHVSHVINYDYPHTEETYTHRTGRAGRMGREGVAMTFVARRDFGSLRRLQETRVEKLEWIGEAPDLSKARSRSRVRTFRGRGGRRGGRSRPRKS
ncbi:MAG: RNA helicase [Gemmatimonadetes bacterium]|nr:RNA helicase [Gemmatimonadota bacterium]|tara:strand:- start:6688 stop:7887 length:1200 start_codon:yes stop_codon:yes gene_type:complete